jgi:hypothetical protein
MAPKDGFGKDVAASKHEYNGLKIIKCSVSNCSKCAADYTKCTACTENYAMDFKNN